MKNNGYYKWSLTKLVASAMFALAPSLVALNRSYAKTLDVNPSMTVTEINNVISSSDPNDTINFTTGTYTVPLEWPPVYFSLKPDRNYTFDEKGKVSNSWMGRNFAYKPIIVNSEKNLLGKIVTVEVSETFGTYLKGEAIKEQKETGS